MRDYVPLHLATVEGVECQSYVPVHLTTVEAVECRDYVQDHTYDKNDPDYSGKAIMP